MKLVIFIYIAAITVANLLVWWLGPWWSTFNSFLLIGLDLSLRDKLHDQYGFKTSLSVVLVAGCVSYLLNPSVGQIAIASVIAFIFAGLADAMWYQKLKGKPAMMRMNGSNVVGAAVDSLLFPTIAFGALMPHIVVIQFAAKVLGGAFYAWVLTRNNRD